jgi:hypothetical protein
MKARRTDLAFPCKPTLKRHFAGVKKVLAPQIINYRMMSAMKPSQVKAAPSTTTRDHFS